MFRAAEKSEIFLLATLALVTFYVINYNGTPKAWYKPKNDHKNELPLEEVINSDSWYKCNFTDSPELDIKINISKNEVMIGNEIKELVEEYLKVKVKSSLAMVENEALAISVLSLYTVLDAFRQTNGIVSLTMLGYRFEMQGAGRR